MNALRQEGLQQQLIFLQERALEDADRLVCIACSGEPEDHLQEGHTPVYWPISHAIGRLQLELFAQTIS